MPELDRRTALRWGAIAMAGGLATFTAGCSKDKSGGIEEAALEGYVSGDGTIEKLAPAQRGEPIALDGTTLEGEAWSMKGKEGTVVVVNVWGSWCPPCIEETPDLQKAWEQVEAQKLDVEFIGLNKMESPETGLAFQRSNKVSYPSLAYDGGKPILALRGAATATPTTIVLDRQGRVAARVSGPVSTSVVTGLVNDVLAEE